MRFYGAKLKRILAFAGPLMLVSGAALAATSGWPVDATITSATNFFGTDVANGLFWGGAVTVAGHLTAGFEWGRAANVATGAMAGGSILSNANGVATVSGISPGATIHLLNHPAVHAAIHVARHLLG
jgi:hypothetical protein